MFPSDKALILHFVSLHPDNEDLEETLQDWIEGESFEKTKKMVAKKGIENFANKLDLEPALLTEILEAK